jgi:hypothetical protein
MALYRETFAWPDPPTPAAQAKALTFWLVAGAITLVTVGITCWVESLSDRDGPIS